MSPSESQTATFAAGCFWGVEKFFGELDGVLRTRVGYTGGHRQDPTYEQVCTGSTGHAEAIEIVFDPQIVSYAELLTFFFMHHDPTTPDRQGNDMGPQYRSAIFYHTENQRVLAEQAVKLLDNAGVFDDPVITEIAPAGAFYAAEEYHQKYLIKNPGGYCHVLNQPPQVADALKSLKGDTA